MLFVDVKNDVAFRKIFGNEHKKIILLSFLNAVLNPSPQNRIVHVEIQNPYQLPIIRNLKASIIDVKARDVKGNSYIIEMQLAEPDGLDKRLLYYMGKDYSQQIESGDKYTELNPVIFIGIFDFHFTRRSNNNYLAHHAICDIESGERILTDMDFYFIDLPKFKKNFDELDEIIDKWVYFIKEAANLDVIPDNLNDKGLKEAYQDANRHNWSKAEMEAYQYAAMREQDERGKVTAAEKKALEKGREEGRHKEKIEIAKGMKSKGLTAEFIAELTGLTVVEIENL